MRIGDRRLAAGLVVLVALAGGVAVGIVDPDEATGDRTTPAAPNPRHVSLASRDGPRGWNLVAEVASDGSPRLTLAAVDGRQWGVDGYSDTVSLREAEAWVVPGDRGVDDPFETLVAGPVPDGIDLVAARDQHTEVQVLAEVRTVDDVSFFVARFAGTVRHLEVVGWWEGVEVFREARQATYVDVGAGPIEGDTWVLDLIGERHWKRIDVVVEGRGPDAQDVRTTAWGAYEYVERRVADGHIYDAFIGGVRLTPGRFGFTVFDRRRRECPADDHPVGTSEDDLPEGSYGVTSAFHLRPWTEESWLRERGRRIEVLDELDLGGREVLRVRITFRDDTPPQLATARRHPDGLVWLVDRETGVIVREEQPHPSPTTARIVGVDDQVEPRALDDVVVPAGPIAYRLSDDDERGNPRRSTDLAGPSTLADVIEGLAPPGERLVPCPPSPPPQNP